MSLLTSEGEGQQQCSEGVATVEQQTAHNLTEAEKLACFIPTPTIALPTSKE